MDHKINLPMDLRDLSLWESGELQAFALPLRDVSDLDFYFSLKPETEANILEPFKKLKGHKDVELNGIPTRKEFSGVLYRRDGKAAWFPGELPDEYEEAKRWSEARQLPEFAVRRKAVVTGVENTTLLNFTKQQINLLKLDYASQGDPQTILEAYEPDKDADLLYKWWRRHYKTTLAHENNPNVVILHLSKPI